MKTKDNYLPPQSEEIQLTTGGIMDGEGIIASSGESIGWGGDYDSTGN